MKKRFSFLLLIASMTMQAQSDSAYSLADCEKLFLSNNLTLLASKFNVEAAQAAVIQARLWENPSFSIQLIGYNPDKKKFFDVGSDGDKSFSLEQLIHLGGKKHNEVQFAKTNAAISQMEFQDLLRNLKFQLRQSYFASYFDNQSYQAITKQMESLNLLINSYEVQVNKGNIAMKDLVRLKSLYLDFRSKKSELFKTIAENQSNLALLTGKDNLNLRPDSFELSVYYKKQLPTIDSLYQAAIHNRPDYLLAEKQIEASAWNLKWQKSLAVPDLTLGTNWSQRGAAFPNAWTLSVGVPLNLWNRNQGNIKAANAQLKAVSATQSNMTNKVMQEVVLCNKKWNEAFQNVHMMKPETLDSFKNVAESMFENFQHGNVSLIEFTDFMESYTQSLMQYNQLGKELVNSCEEINYYTSTTIF